MAQIDFTRFFASPASAEAATLAADRSLDTGLDSAVQNDAPVVRGGLNGSQWTNVAFVAVATAGALFCALFFFGGADLLLTAATWPRELLYPRPGGTGDSSASKLFGATAADPLIPAPSRTFEQSGDPFHRAARPLDFNQPYGFSSPFGNGRSPGTPGTPSSPSLPVAPNPGSFLSQLPIPPRGGDALARAFNEGVADAARTQASNSARTVAAVTSRTDSVRHVATRTSRQVRQRTAAPATSRARQNVQNTARTVGNTAGSQTVRNTPVSAAQLTNTARSVSPMTQQLNSMRGMNGIGAGARSSIGSSLGRH